MRALLAGLSLSLSLLAQTPLVGPPVARRIIPAERFQLLILKQVAPDYPAEALAEKIQGDVLVAVQINEKGSLQSIKPIKGPVALREAAMNALRQWRFRPYFDDRIGIAVPVRSEVTVHFPPQ